MTDFEESEKLPNDIETMLQLLLAHILSSSMYKQFDALPALRALQVLLLTIAKQVDGTESSGAASHLLRNSEVTFILALEQSGIFVPTLVWPQMLGLRQRLQRLHVIRDTSFLLPIYTLFDTLTLLVFVLLLGTEFASPVAGYLTTGVFAFLYVYMALLVRDLGTSQRVGGSGMAVERERRGRGRAFRSSRASERRREPSHAAVAARRQTAGASLTRRELSFKEEPLTGEECDALRTAATAGLMTRPLTHARRPTPPPPTTPPFPSADDPFGYPERYYEIAVRTSVVRPFTPFEAVIWAASIDFFCVFGSFASQLSEEIKLRGGEPAHALLPFGQSVRMQAASRREALRVIHPGAIPPSPSPGAFVSPLPGGGRL